MTPRSVLSHRVRLLLPPLLLSALTQGCGSSGFPKYSKLESLRVLSLKADLPDVGDTNATVTISPIVSDEAGGTRSIAQSVTHCTAPDLATGAEPSCDGVAGAQTQTLGNVTFTGASRTSTPGQNQFTIQIPANFLQTCPTAAGVGPCSVVTRTNGRAYLIVYRLTAGSESLTAIRRIFVKDTSIPGLVLNTNPTLTSISNGSVDLNDGDASTKPIGTVSLTAVVPGVGTAGGPETFSYLSSNGGVSSRSEDFLVSWFVNVGEFKFTRTVQNSANELRSDSSGLALTIAVVLRDGRGGEDTKVFLFAP